MDLIDFLKSYAGRFYNNDVNENAATLQKIEATPQVQIKNLEPNVLGQYKGSTNTLNFPTNNPKPNTLAHETTHALDDQMRDFYLMYASIFPREQQTLEQKNYIDAYKKLRPEDTKLPLDKEDVYRTNASELRAFGVGNNAVPYNTGYALPHVDATMAQEFAILRALFNKTLK